MIPAPLRVLHPRLLNYSLLVFGIIYQGIVPSFRPRLFLQKLGQLPLSPCLTKMNREDRAALERFKGRQKLLRNPHFQPLGYQRGGKSLIVSEENPERARQDTKQR